MNWYLNLRMAISQTEAKHMLYQFSARNTLFQKTAATGLLSAEVLNVRGGKVHEIEVVCAYVPYHASTGW